MLMSSFLVSFFTIFLILKIIEKKIIWPQYLIASVIFSLLLYYKFDLIYYRIITNYFFLVLILYFLTKESLIKLFFSTFVVYLLMAFSEIIYYLIFSFFIEIKANFFSNVMIILITFLLYYLTRRFWKKINNIDYQNKLLMLGFFLSLITVLSFLIHRLYFEIDFLTNILVSILGIALIVSFLYIIICDKNSYRLLENEYRNINNDILLYEKLLKELSLKQHDYQNDLIFLKTYVNDPKVSDYISQKVSKKKIKNLSRMETLLYSKFLAMKIKPKCLYMNNLVIADFALFQKMGVIINNLLDNADEAAAITEKPLIEVVIYNNNDNICIIIANNFKGEIDLEKMFKCKYSTKGIGRGLGLYIVKKIVNGEKTLFLNTKIVGGILRQELIIEGVLQDKKAC